MNIKQFISNHLTSAEQKVIYFILFIICLGSYLSLFSYISPNKDKEQDQILSETIDIDYIHHYDLLSVTEEHLQYIDGIGPALARRIVEYQTEVGFTKVEDLLSIRGIGNTRYNEYKEFFFVEGDSNILLVSDTDLDNTNTPQEKPSISQTPQKININTATQEELTTLKGIGPVKAAEIINYRNKNNFQKIDDIVNVKGIGPKTFDQIKDFITVGE